MSAEHWGRRPRDWAELAEPSNEPLFREVLTRVAVQEGTRLVDIGCGSGFAAAMAADLGAIVTGLDITPQLLAIAQERVPQGDFREGEMDRLPFGDQSFDAAVGFNAFQFADDPVHAVREAGRVVRSGGLVAATTFAEPERNESTALHLALEPLRESSGVGAGAGAGAGGGVGTGATASAGARHLPYGLSAPAGLEQLVTAAGLEPVQAGEVPLLWAHDTMDAAVRAVLASGGGAMAIQNAGEPAARAALEQAVAPFTASDGSVAMRNVFRFVIARRR